MANSFSFSQIFVSQLKFIFFFSTIFSWWVVKEEGCLLWSKLPLCRLQPMGGEVLREARGTSALLRPCWLYLGDTRWKRIKARRETFHLSLCRYPGTAEMSTEAPPVLLSFSCCVRTGGWGRWREATPRLNLCHLPKLCSSTIHPV